MRQFEPVHVGGMLDHPAESVTDRFGQKSQHLNDQQQCPERRPVLLTSNSP